MGIDTGKVFVKQPNKDSAVNMTVEEVGRSIETIIDTFSEKYPDRPLVFIWDSVGQTPSEDEVSKDYGEKNVGARAKAISQLVLKIGPRISATKSLFIGINQVRDEIGGNMMFPTLNVPGGNAWEHYASLRIETKQRGAIKQGTDKIGHTLGLNVRKSKVSRPFQSNDITLISDNGIDYEENIARMSFEMNVLGGTAQSYEYIDSNGEIHKKKRSLFVEWLKTPEGRQTRGELMRKLIFESFPNGYPALKNKSLDISGWEDAVGLAEMYEQASKEEASSSQPEIDPVAEATKEME